MRGLSSERGIAKTISTLLVATVLVIVLGVVTTLAVAPAYTLPVVLAAVFAALIEGMAFWNQGLTVGDMRIPLRVLLSLVISAVIPTVTFFLNQPVLSKTALGVGITIFVVTLLRELGYAPPGTPKGSQPANPSTPSAAASPLAPVKADVPSSPYQTNSIWGSTAAAVASYIPGTSGTYVNPAQNTLAGSSMNYPPITEQ